MEVVSPLTGEVIEVVAPDGASVRAGSPVLVVESMKMHHEIEAPASGTVSGLALGVGDAVRSGDVLCEIDVTDGVAEQGGHRPAEPESPDEDSAGSGFDGVAEQGGHRPAEPESSDEDSAGSGLARPDLERAMARRERTLDAARPDAVAKRRELGRRTARENLEDLCDSGTFSEYGGLAIAAQRARRSEEELIAQTPADGMIVGTGSVNGELFGPEEARCVAMSYDYTVLAGTQGVRNHRKTDRMLEIAERLRLPVVLFAEGGGGRPGDTDRSELFHLDVSTFRRFAALSGLVPRVAIVSGRCFAGNAALAGCADVIIATPDASIGMGGPAMIEGGGLGSFAPEEVGPVEMQEANGVIDLLVAGEAEAVAAARRYLAFFQGDVPAGASPDPAALRSLVPEDPKRTHDARAVLQGIVDEGSALELRPGFGRGIVTALARIEGRAVGVIANDPKHLSGAIDAEASDKAARFIQLCDAFGLPVVSLIDTPGFMVGPDSEAEAMVRRCSRMFLAAATSSVPWIAVVLRRAYGLGAQAMAGGDFHAPVLNIAWPSGEFGAMGVEGAVRLALRRELEEIPDEADRERRVQDVAASVREQSGAINMAAHFEIDDVIDPAETRERIVGALRSLTRPEPGRRRTMVDSW